MKKVLLHVLLAICVITLGMTNAASVYARSIATEIVSPTQDNPRVSRSILSPFRQIFPSRTSRVKEKLISNVKIFPNPIVDQIHLSFRLDKQTEVSIKVMDALGNEIMTLLNQELDSGNQSHVFETHNKLSKGYYFIRVAAGGETVVKRISVL